MVLRKHGCMADHGETLVCHSTRVVCHSSRPNLPQCHLPAGASVCLLWSSDGLYVFNRKNNCAVMSLWGSVSFIQSWRFHCVNYNCLHTDWNYSLRFIFFFWIILRSEVLGMIKITWGNSICLCTSCLNRRLRACNWTNVLEIFYFHHVFICELLMVCF